jgi:hypothetical protein
LGLCSLSIVDVDEQVKPAKDAPFIISEREATDIEPAVGPISTAVATLDVVCGTGLVGLLLRRNRVLKIIRMDDIGSFPTSQLLECLAEVFKGWLVDCFDFTGGCGDGYGDRSAVDD